MTYDIYLEYYTLCSSFHFYGALTIFILSLLGFITFLWQGKVTKDADSFFGALAIVFIIILLSLSITIWGACSLGTVKIRAMEKAESLSK